MPEKAALHYAQSDADFDMVILRLMGIISLPASTILSTEDSMNQKSPPSAPSSSSSVALLSYLEEKLKILNLAPTGDTPTLSTHNKSKKTMMCTWVCELMLHKISSLELSNDDQPPNPKSNASPNANPNSEPNSGPNSIPNFGPNPSPNPNSNRSPSPIPNRNRSSSPSIYSSPGSNSTSSAKGVAISAAINEFKDFLRKYKTCLDHATVLTLLRSRGRSSGSESNAQSLIIFYAQVRVRAIVRVRVTI
jgi:hypothetical protein